MGLMPGTLTRSRGQAPQGYSTPTSQFNNLLSQLSDTGFNPQTAFGNPLELLMLGSNQQRQGLQQSYGFGQERMGLQREQLGMQRDQLGRAQGLAPKYRGLEELGFGLAEGDLNAAGLGAWRGAERSQKGLTSSATARGSLQTQGTREGFTEIQQDLQSQLEGIGRDRSRLDISKEQARLGYEEEQARMQDASKNLDLMGKQLGISSREAEASLNNALQQLGLSTRMSAGDIARSVQNQIAGQFDPFSGITGQIIQLAFGG